MTAAPGDPPGSLPAAAVAVLSTADAVAKARAGQAAALAWRCGHLQPGQGPSPPDRPARPAAPRLRPPQDVPRRRIGGGAEGRFALLHALAHIELNAIDLAWDLVARFTAEDLPPAFYDDWVAVADDEARHFLLLQDRLQALGGTYGDLDAHDGLWQAAQATADDLLARLAIVPLVLEARGLDVTPGMIARLQVVGDRESAAVLEVIYQDEIGHVAAGRRWFGWLCDRRGCSARECWEALVRARFRGRVKPPFNSEARTAAGLDADWYLTAAAGS